MFWTNARDLATIERAKLDGTTPVTLFEVSVGKPRGLALDPERKKIFWIDALFYQINCANYDGSHREVLIDGKSHDTLSIYRCSCIL